MTQLAQIEAIENRRNEMNKSKPLGLYTPPDDPLHALFTPEVVARLRVAKSSSDLLAERLDVISACGPYPSDRVLANRLRRLRAKRAAWETYLQAAFAYGLFEGEHGKDLKSRLIRVDNVNFRSAISECLVCWLLSGVFSLPVRPKPPGREGKILELLVDLPDGDIRVEVKAPYPVNPYHPTSFEDPLKRMKQRAEQFNAGIQKVLSLLTRCLKKANDQFEENVRNVLFLTFFEDARLYWPRDLMTRAFLGEEKETYSVDTQMNPPRVKAAIRRFPTGQLLNPNYPKPYPPPYKQTPHFTRVSAIVLVQERFKLTTFFPEICHDVWILHNPHAEHPVPPELWRKYPQLLKDDDSVMRWTDGYDSWREEDQRWDGHNRWPSL